MTDTVIFSGAVLIGNLLISLLLDQRGKNATDNMIADQKRLIGKLFEWKDTHNDESAKIRLEFSRQLSELSASIKVNGAQYAEILRRIDELKTEISEMRKHND